MRVAEFDKLVPEPLVQPCPDQADAFLEEVMIDEEREPVDRPVGGVLASDNLHLFDGVCDGNVLGGVAAELFEVKLCALDHEGSLGGGERGVNNASIAVVTLQALAKSESGQSTSKYRHAPSSLHEGTMMNDVAVHLYVPGLAGEYYFSVLQRRPCNCCPAEKGHASPSHSIAYLRMQVYDRYFHEKTFDSGHDVCCSAHPTFWKAMTS